MRFNENGGGGVRVHVYTVYPITNLNCAKPKWWNYENRRVQQFPDFHVFIFQLCAHPCPMRVRVLDALTQSLCLSSRLPFAVHHLHECIYVSYWTQYTQFDIIIFGDEFSLSNNMMRGLLAKDILKLATFENEHFNFIAKLESTESKRAPACTWANKLCILVSNDIQ